MIYDATGTNPPLREICKQSRMIGRHPDCNLGLSIQISGMPAPRWWICPMECWEFPEDRAIFSGRAIVMLEEDLEREGLPSLSAAEQEEITRWLMSLS